MIEWNVYKEDVNNKNFIKYNIFTHHNFVQDLAKVIKAYEKREKQELLDLRLFAHALTTSAYNRKYDAEEKARLKAFEDEVRAYCKYNFCSRCEYELLLCSWPNTISLNELARLNQEVKEHKEKYPHLEQHRITVNCEVCDKISVYDQLELNWSNFFSYIKENIKDIKKLANQMKKEIQTNK